MNLQAFTKGKNAKKAIWLYWLKPANLQALSR